MPEQRVYKSIRVRHEATCCYPACARSFQPGDMAMWTQGGKVWCVHHDGPGIEMPSFELSPEQEMARIDAWIDRRIEDEEAKRRLKGGVPANAGLVGEPTLGAVAIPPATTQVSVTSDPRYEDAF